MNRTPTFTLPPYLRAGLFSPVANGSTLVRSGTNNTLFELSEAGDVVWQYLSPRRAMGPSESARGVRTCVQSLRRRL